MLVDITALCMVRESPTLIGIVGSCGATPPASNTITRFGACVRCANIAVAHGTPVPTATVFPSSRQRAAQQIISSIALYVAVIFRGPEGIPAGAAPAGEPDRRTFAGSR